MNYQNNPYMQGYQGNPMNPQMGMQPQNPIQMAAPPQYGQQQYYQQQMRQPQQIPYPNQYYGAVYQPGYPNPAMPQMPMNQMPPNIANSYQQGMMQMQPNQRPTSASGSFQGGMMPPQQNQMPTPITNSYQQGMAQMPNQRPTSISSSFQGGMMPQPNQQPTSLNSTYQGGMMPQPNQRPLSNSFQGGMMQMAQSQMMMANSSNCIPPMLNPPTIGYIPPPPNAFEDYVIDKTMERYYTNLYSSLAALNVIFDLYINSAIDEKSKTTAFDLYIDLLMRNMSPCGIKTMDQLKRFAQKSNLDISYCKKYISEKLEKDKPAPIKGSTKFYVRFGEILLKFKDLLFIIQEPKDYVDHRFSLQSQINDIVQNVKKCFPEKVTQIKILEDYVIYISKNPQVTSIVKMKNDLNNVILDIQNSLNSK